MVDTILTNRPTEIVGKDMEMNELTIDEINEVNGGIGPLVVAVLATDAFAIGFTAGAMTGYMTIVKLFEK